MIGPQRQDEFQEQGTLGTTVAKMRSLSQLNACHGTKVEHQEADMTLPLFMVSPEWIGTLSAFTGAA
jgi:hypothetical protein